MRVLDLFSGIGGFALAFEAAGFRTIAFAEIEPYPCQVLAQHWPKVPNLGDVRTIDGADFRGAVDVVCGGFPCQDISTAGKGSGIHGTRSGLWFEMLRIIRGARPAFCLLENVPALRTRGADDVLEGLEEAGYAARPFVVGAINAGAPHRRQRVWILAYSLGGRRKNADPGLCAQKAGPGDSKSGGPNWSSRYSHPLAHAHDAGQPADWRQGQARDYVGRSGEDVADTERQGLAFGSGPARERAFPATAGSGWWATEPAVGRVANGVPHRAHRIKALGNSIVPAVAYPFAVWIAQQLQERKSP